MKVGDIVMFNDVESDFAKWFFGHLAEVKRIRPVNHNGEVYCRVHWLLPVQYFDTYATVSDFRADHFGGGL